MSNKQRQLLVSGVTSTTNFEVLKQHFEAIGPVQNCFFKMNSVNQAIVTMKQLEDLKPAIKAMDGFTFEGNRLKVVAMQDVANKGKGKGASNGTSFGAPTGTWGDKSNAAASSSSQSSAPNAQSSVSTTALAPAPRLIFPQGEASNSTAAGDSVSKVADSMSALQFGKDTWELSLEDSDLDDGYQPPKRDNKPPLITKAEWNEAYEFTKSFARHGGAILAVDVESWDRDQDYIIEVGLAYVSYQKGNAIAPRVKVEHIIVEEHVNKRNGLYSPDAKDRFAFGKSKTMTEFDTSVRLRLLMKTLGQDQPLILLFHNAKSEKNYFQLMNIDDLENAPERIPNVLLRPTTSTFKNKEWKGSIVLDTQRLWKSYLIGKEGEKDAPLALGKICKSIGVTTMYLHNAGNDALYTLKVFMKLAESESRARAEQRAANSSSVPGMSAPRL